MSGQRQQRLTASLVGRADEMAVLQGLLETGGVVLITGAAGMGKSRLAAEAAERAREVSWRVRVAQADQADRRWPFHLLEQAASRRVVRGSSTTAAASPDPIDVADRVLDELDRVVEDGPLLVVLDDMQWADDGSLIALRSVVRRMSPVGLALVILHRPDERSELAELADAVLAVGGREMVLGPLAPSAVAELVRALAPDEIDGLTTEVADAQGNPYRILDAVAGPGNEGGDLSILRVAAALGRVIEAERLVSLTGRPQDEVDATLRQAVASGLLTDTDTDIGGLRFAHDLVREEVLSGLPPGDLERMHLDIAVGLERADADQGEIASHLVLGATESAIPVLRRAAATAPSPAALELHDTVLALLREDDPQRFEVLATKARTLLVMGRAADAAETASSLVPLATDLATRLRLHATEVLGRMARGDDPEPVPPMSTWLDLLDLSSTDLGIDAVHPMVEYALLQTVTGHPVAARETLDLLPASPKDEVIEVLVETAGAATAMYLGEIEDAVGHADAVRESIAGTDRIVELAGYVPLVVAGAVLSRGGRHDDGLGALAGGRQMLHAFGLVWMESLCDANTAMVLIDAGRWDDALAVIDAGVSGGVEHMQLAYQPWLLAMRALILARRGDLAAAETACGRAEGGNPSVFNGFDHVRWARATIAAARGDEPARRAALDEMVDSVLATGVGCLPGSVGLEAVRAAMTDGDGTARARELVALLPDSATLPVVAALASAGRALVAGQAGTLADAASVLEPVLPYDAALVWEDAAVVAAARGEAMGDTAQRAAFGFRALGAKTDLERLARRVPVLPAEPAEATRVGLDALTRTERRVTRLVVEGRSNIEIAERLSVSRRTVESHLARIFTKMGVRSRLQLANAARSE